MADTSNIDESLSINKISSQLLYPIRDLKNDTFFVVIHLPQIGYDEIVVTIDPSYVGVSATILKGDRLLSLFDEAYAPQIYSTRVKIPGGLDIDNADAYYDGGFIKISIPYLK